MCKNIVRALFGVGFLAALPALASPIQAEFTGVNGVNAFGYYIGAYYGKLESQNVSLYCDNFANEVNFGQKWTANLSTITTGSNLKDTRYGDVKNAGTVYQEVAWLDMQFAQQPTSQWADIHATIWQMFDPKEAPLPTSGYWLTQAQENYSGTNYDNFRVVTNVGPVSKTGQVQEFITVLTPPMTGSMAAPEPGSALLMGTGLTFAALLARKCRLRLAAQR